MATAYKPRILPVDTPTLKLDEEGSHTLSFVSAYPALSHLVQPFEAIQQDLLPLLQQERALERAVVAARVAIVVIDDELDALAERLSNTLLAEIGEKKRKDPRYQHYYKEPVSRLKRPVLGTQLETMEGWVDSLIEPQCSEPVRQCGQQIDAVTKRARAAMKALSEAEQALAKFQTLGEKKAFVDRLNALRLSAFGQITELTHARPDLNLPADFANRFFLRDTSDRKPTIAEVEQSILSTRAKLERLEKLLAKLVQEAEEEARLAEEAEMREAMKAIEAAERQRAEAEQKMEAVRARIAQRKKAEQ